MIVGDKPTLTVVTAQAGDTGDAGNNGGKPPVSASPPTAKKPGTPGTPPGFSLDHRGVWFKDPNDDEASPRWICSPLKVAAFTRNERGENWGRYLTFEDPDGGKHEWACPMEMLAGDGLDFRRTLLNTGLLIAPGYETRKLLATYVQASHPTARVVCTDRCGWHGAVFVLPDETIGERSERIVLQTSAETPALTTAGTLDGWREKVAALAIGNSRLTFAMSAPFAAPLLHFSGDAGGGSHFVGPSSIGKTLALRTAASVSHSPDELRTWRATANGLEGVATLHNDGLLILDELAEIDPRDAGAAAYMLANGTGKARARRDGSAKPSARWRALFLSSGEVGLGDHMSEARLRARAGQEVRLAEIPADAGAGHGLFEDLHGSSDGAAFAGRLLDAARAHHGTAWRAYLRKLVTLSAEDIRKKISVSRQAFLEAVVPSGADGQARRVADRFALIAAGGELATSLGITGWPEGQATWAAKTCFAAWLDRRGGAGAQEELHALEQVQHFLESHGESRFSAFDSRDSAEYSRTFRRAGYRRTRNGRLQYLVLPQVFRWEVCAGLDYRQVAKVLRGRGLLETQEHDRLTFKPRGIGRVYAVWAEADERVPGKSDLSPVAPVEWGRGKPQDSAVVPGVPGVPGELSVEGEVDPKDKGPVNDSILR